MKVPIFMIWVPMGLMAGGLAGLVMRTGGFGLIADLVLGLAGSLIGGLLFLAVQTSPELGWPTVCVGTFVGAASVIAGQRWWYAHV
jgi:uncharacterized membrane protein YeaQ/YmgE (transglycosylase-associated protein family)